MAFDEDGSFAGFDGCNTISGSFRTSSVGFDLDVTGSTERGCSKQVWLGEASHARFDGDVLVVTDAAGDALGMLERGSESD